MNRSALAGNDIFLEEELEDIGHRLKDTLIAGVQRAAPVLHARIKFPVHPFQVRRKDELESKTGEHQDIQ